MIGSRYVPGRRGRGGVHAQAAVDERRNQRLRPADAGLTSKDNSGAFRCYRVSKLAEIDWSRVRSRGYSFQEEILYWCQEVGCRIGETPILFENRRAGSSKINMREAVSALWILLQLGVSRRIEPQVRTTAVWIVGGRAETSAGSVADPLWRMRVGDVSASNLRRLRPARVRGR